ncbi:MAG: hypothetical protein COB85_05645 [Bacteroidetes bacterium]|nr:MAG: hypothetical protein COB85_05645 [Bacteroidota bacterium]
MKFNKEMIEYLIRCATFYVVFLMLLICSTEVYGQQADHVRGEIIVQLNYKFEAADLVNTINVPLETALRIEYKKQLSSRLNIHLLSFDPSVWVEDNLLREIRGKEGVFAAQFNHFIQQRDTIPNDPRFGDQWDMNNTGQSGGVLDADIDAIEAWDTATGGVTAMGDTIVVAVIDGGFDLSHEDLDFWKNRMEIPNNGIDDDSNGYIDDFDGWNAYNSDGNISSSTHGTHVSGTVGAIGNNGIGLVGVNWNVKIMPIQGSSGNEATVVEAYGYVLELRATYNETNGGSGAFVVSTNSSFGSNFGDPVDFPIWCALYDSLGSVGILSAGATMNLNEDVDVVNDIPTACPSDWMISVTNTTDNDTKNNGAAYGLTTIDLGAPGTDIWSTEPGDTYGQLTGTSMATPHVAGAVALMYDVACQKLIMESKQSPDSIALIIRDVLFDGTDSISALDGITLTGGRLNINNSALLLSGFDCQLVSVNNLEGLEKEIILFPNPVGRQLTLRGLSGIVERVGIFNLLGQEVFGMKHQVLTDRLLVSLDGIKPGCYLLRVETNKETFSTRLIRY